MAQPWVTIGKEDTPDGVLELRQRGERDFLILINNRVLMNSSANRSEIALGECACRAIAHLPLPRVFIGGLGMGLTLRAALDVLSVSARITVVEINPVVHEWCGGPLGRITGDAVKDPRVRVVIDDVAAVLAGAGRSGDQKFDAVIIDLYEGPHAKNDPRNHPFYGSKAIANIFSVLAPGGVFAAWGESPDAGFERRLQAAGFSVGHDRPGRGGLRHAVYLARKRG